MHFALTFQSGRCLETSFSTTAIIYSGCCYSLSISETWFSENTSGFYICCADRWQVSCLCKSYWHL